MLLLALEYVAFVFVASLGVLQWVAVNREFKGLWLFPHPLACRLFALVSIASSYAWFFLSRDRLRPGLEGTQQLLLFSLASLLAVGATLVLSSLFRARGQQAPSPGNMAGLEALKEKGYLEALRRRR